MTEELIREERVALPVLAAELDVDRRTIARWVDLGYEGKRLESYRIGKKRYSTREAARRFLAAVNRESVLMCEAVAQS